MAALMMFAVALPAATPAARAAALRPPQPLWLVKSSDLVDLAQQAATDGVTLPAFTWIGCGGPSDVDHCVPGQRPILTSYWQLYSRAKAGWRGTAVFDIEPWTYTPQEQRLNPNKWICLAAQLHRVDPYLRVMITPFARPTATLMISEDVEAAKCGAYAVDVQTQFANGSPRLFGSFIRTAVGAIRRVNRKIVILAGLATNQPTVQTAANLVADYHLALAAGVQGFWLNASDWQNRNQCAATQGGVGCPEVGVQFLTDIGLATSIGAASAAPASSGSATTSPSPAATGASPAATGPSPAGPSPAITSTSPATTSVGPATTSTGRLTGNPAAGTQATPAPSDAVVRVAFDNRLTQASRQERSKQIWQIVGALALVMATGLAGWLARRRSA
jgi:hypothetical protein